MEIEPLHGDFGARVGGVDLTGPLPSDLVATLHAAIDHYSVLLFPEQDMSDEAQLALTTALGEPEESHIAFGRDGEIVYIGTIGNVIDDTTERDGGDPHTVAQRGNNLWHSDSSFRRVPSYVSILHAYEVPAQGGETEFVSQRAAYARLSTGQQTEIDDLHVLHDYVFSRTKVAPVHDNHAASLPPIEQRLVRTNPSNGLRNYYAGSHARSIVGWSGIDSRRLIDELNDFATPARAPLVAALEAGRHRHLGQPLHPASGSRLRRRPVPSPHAPDRVRGAGPTLEE